MSGVPSSGVARTEVRPPGQPNQVRWPSLWPLGREAEGGDNDSPPEWLRSSRKGVSPLVEEANEGEPRGREGGDRLPTCGVVGSLTHRLATDRRPVTWPRRTTGHALAE